MNDRLSRGSKIVPTLFIGKWTVKILYMLKERPHRHGKLRHRLGNISQRMLTRTLRNLESTGLIARRVTRSKSLAVEYSLTKLGRGFIIPLARICRWIDHHNMELSAIIRLANRTRSRRNLPQLSKP
ncbi:MAG TPA: helix-turn-helix domain-containing protein [Nitrospira sp.]|nr:helix-turn-helix domain-containing protein [Nitrospira sp.]